MATLSHSPVRVARVALAAAEKALPAHASKFSRKDHLTLPQLTACLVLQRFLRTSLRGAEAFLKDSSDVRRVLHIEQAPDHTALWRAHRALTPEHLERLTEETVRLALRAHVLPEGSGATLIPDATGLTRSRASHFAAHSQSSYARRLARKKKRRRRKRMPKSAWHYPKWTIAIDRESFLILAQLARRGPYPGVQDFAPLALEAHSLRPSALVLADAGFESCDNLRLCREWLGARVVMRVGLRPRDKRGAHSIRCPYRRALALHLPRRLYSMRNAAESNFSADKRRFGDLTPN